MASHTHMYQELRRGQNQKRNQRQLRDMGESGESRSDISFHHHPGLSTKQSTWLIALILSGKIAKYG
mgnify:CR=1 FL=1